MFLKSLQISQESICVKVFFNKVTGPQNCNFIKKRLQHRYFPVKFAKFSRTPHFTEHLRWLVLTVSGFQPATLLKNWFRQKCFSVNFAKFLRTSSDRTPPDDCFLPVFICGFWEVFQNTSFTEHLWQTSLFHVKVAKFQPPDTAKNYFTGAFQAFYIRTRSSHSKAFIYLKSLKIICEEVNS